MTTALYVGRFQPFHLGHLAIIKRILQENDRIIIAIGSAEQNYLAKDPLSGSERFQLIDETLENENIPASKYRIIPIRNINNYALWVNHVNLYVPPYQKIYTGSSLVKVCYEAKPSPLHHKGSPPVEIVELERLDGISASKIRQTIIEGDHTWEEMVPKTVAKKLKEWNFINRMKTITDKNQ